MPSKSPKNAVVVRSRATIECETVRMVSSFSSLTPLIIPPVENRQTRRRRGGGAEVWRRWRRIEWQLQWKQSVSPVWSRPGHDESGSKIICEQDETKLGMSPRQKHVALADIAHSLFFAISSMRALMVMTYIDGGSKMTENHILSSVPIGPLKSEVGCSDLLACRARNVRRPWPYPRQKWMDARKQQPKTTKIHQICAYLIRMTRTILVGGHHM
jgi:hypothetical protein